MNQEYFQDKIIISCQVGEFNSNYYKVHSSLEEFKKYKAEHEYQSQRGISLISKDLFGEGKLVTFVVPRSHLKNIV